jgi:hypothetical protein
MASSKIIVSPGVYTSEKDLTFVTQSIGVTTLGLAGEAPKGPAFEPVFIRNFEEYTTFFGGLNPSKYPTLPSLPKYEMGYVARQYLKQSNQLFVTRILGLTGYNAGKAWGIRTYANIDWSTLIFPPTDEFESWPLTTSPTGWQIYVDSTGTDVLFSSPSDPKFATGNTFNVNGIKFYSTDATGNDNLVTYADLSNVPLEVTGWTKSETSECLYNVVIGTLSGSSSPGTIDFSKPPLVFTASCYTQYDKLLVALIRSRVTSTTDYDITGSQHYLVRNATDRKSVV